MKKLKQGIFVSTEYIDPDIERFIPGKKYKVTKPVFFKGEFHGGYINGEIDSESKNGYYILANKCAFIYGNNWTVEYEINVDTLLFDYHNEVKSHIFKANTFSDTNKKILEKTGSCKIDGMIYRVSEKNYIY